MSPVPQILIASNSIQGLAVPRASDRSFSRQEPIAFDIYSTVAHPGFGKEGGTTGDLGA